ncbi:hypothetical protein ACFYTS_30705 [Nocardia sp. NPDC004151]|uniref:hypothetical protein n=1 Tax=Nocardia sp. NPDC004151 TaxID=3364304 RepID=UPI0036B7D240
MRSAGKQAFAGRVGASAFRTAGQVRLLAERMTEVGWRVDGSEPTMTATAAAARIRSVIPGRAEPPFGSAGLFADGRVEQAGELVDAVVPFPGHTKDSDAHVRAGVGERAPGSAGVGEHFALSRRGAHVWFSSFSGGYAAERVWVSKSQTQAALKSAWRRALAAAPDEGGLTDPQAQHALFHQFTSPDNGRVSDDRTGQRDHSPRQPALDPKSGADDNSALVHDTPNRIVAVNYPVGAARK